MARTFTIPSWAKAARIPRALAEEFIAGPEGLLELGFAEPVDETRFRLTPSGQQLVRHLGELVVDDGDRSSAARRVPEREAA